MSSSIDRAENGFVIHVSHEGKGKKAAYTSRTFIAPNGRAAMRIANAHIQCAGPKLKSKKAGAKTTARKR